MPTPFNDITPADGNTPSTTGTWTYTGEGSTGAAPLPPAAPGAYDSSISFTGVDPGTYPYTYTVTGCDSDSESTVVYTIYEYASVKNDDCAGARNLVFPYQGGVSKLTEQSLSGSCPGSADPTYSVTVTPTAWGGGTFESDVWFKLSFDVDYPVPPIIVMNIQVDGSPYGTGGVVEPYIAVYTNCSGNLLDAEVPGPGSQEVNVVIDGVFNADFTYYIRVASHAGDEGMFDINVTV
jgi:hypothetical protein